MEARQSLEAQAREKPYVESDLEGAVGGTDSIDTMEASPESLNARLGALRINSHADDQAAEAIQITTASDFATSYPTLDDFEEKQKAALASSSMETSPTTPKRPLPTAPTALSKAGPSSIPPSASKAISEISVEELFPILNPGFDTIEDKERGTKRIVKKVAPKVLLLDLRSRAEWNARRIKNVDCICIEPVYIGQGNLSSSSITAYLQSRASQVEMQLYDSRDRYDMVVICDAASRIVTSDQERLAQALSTAHDRPLKQAPRILIGGVDRWWRKVGDNGVVGTGAEVPSEDPAVFRSKRQAVYIPGPPPASLTPGRGYDRERVAAGFDHPGSPSKPARAYSNSNLTAPPPMPTTPSHAHQPHIPSYHSPQIDRQVDRQTSGASFDYPQLAYQSPQQRQSPYFSRPVNGTATPTPPPPAAAASGNINGYSNRSPLLDSSRGHSMDIARRQAVPPPGGTPIAIQERQFGTFLPGSGSTKSDEVRVGMTGLKNVCNSCYMNSTLQCLNATIPLARFLLDGSYRKAINRVNPLGTQGALAEAFAQLIRVMWSEKYTFVSPVTFREAITRFAPAFRGSDQHDAQEFLAFLLDGLHEDLNYIKQKPPAIEMTAAREEELETLPQQIAAVQEWEIYRARNDSLIVDWFQGQFRSKLTCLTCGKTSTTYNAFLYLSLPIPVTSGRGAKVTLAQCLDAFTKDEILEKADAWHCPRCKKPRRATKKLTISRLPQILLIHLKRFSFKGPFTDKIETLVQFPTTNLDLTNYMPPPLPPGTAPKGSPSGPFVYDLYAATHHFGSLSGGHYTATVRTRGDRGEPQWMYCDDSRITRSDERQIHSPSSYILWWSRKAR